MPAVDRRFATVAGTVRVVCTERADGDFALGAVDDELRATIHPAPWTWLRQVHGATVVVAAGPGDGAGVEADAAVTATAGAPLSVLTADCAPVVLIGDRAIGVVHAGWRGVVAGVIEATAAELGSLGATPVATVLGPCIGPSSYEFGDDELALVSARYGPGVCAATGTGRPALDLPAAVAAACEAVGWPAPEAGPCTSDPAFHSHRTRGDLGRQVTVAWIEP